MKITKFGHSCLLVETGDARLLIDPGVFSPGFETVEGLTAVLVTHQHPDHLDVARVKLLLDRDASLPIVCDDATAGQLSADGGIEAVVASPGAHFDFGCAIDIDGGVHAEIYREIPRIPNVSYIIDERLLHPGDELSAPARDIEILALPTVAPWMSLADAIDFFRAVSPRVAISIHDSITNVPGLYGTHLTNFRPEGSELHQLVAGDTISA